VVSSRVVFWLLLVGFGGVVLFYFLEGFFLGYWAFFFFIAAFVSSLSGRTGPPAEDDDFSPSRQAPYMSLSFLRFRLSFRIGEACFSFCGLDLPKHFPTRG